MKSIIAMFFSNKKERSITDLMLNPIDRAN